MDQYDFSVNLAWGDVALHSRLSPSMVKIHLKRSKCNQFGRGVDVIVGKTDSLTVATMMAYITSRQGDPGPFIITEQREPVTKAWFVQQIRETLTSLGLPQGDYAGHSFALRQQPRQPWRVWRTQPSRPLGRCAAFL